MAKQYLFRYENFRLSAKKYAHIGGGFQESFVISHINRIDNMTKIETYRPRIADNLLARKLKGKGGDIMGGDFYVSQHIIISV